MNKNNSSGIGKPSLPGKRPSGHQYRKSAAEKKEKLDKIISETRKIDSFFKQPTKSSEDHGGQNSNVETTTTGETESIKNRKDADQISEPENQNENDINESLQDQGSSNLQIDINKNVPSEEKIEEVDSNLSFVLPNDPADWIINDLTRDYIAVHGIVNQNFDVNLAESERKYGDVSRCLTKSILQRHLKNGETQHRSFLIYSPSKKKLFCVPCLLFKKDNLCQFSDLCEGFNDWKNVVKRVKFHEVSPDHMRSILSLKERGKLLQRIDDRLTMQLDREIQYWRQILHRVVSVVKKLSARGSPFRGHEDQFGSIKNGYFMMSMELIAEFDPFLAQHIERYANKGKGNPSYLSFTICEELISILAGKVIDEIKHQVQRSKYYSVIIDSTPDVTHVDQLSFVIRYIGPEGSPVERFLEFIPNTGHTGEKLTNALLAVLKKYDIPLDLCRGQSYDNASNMSGIYNGVQAKIMELNPLAFFIPCSAHSLNLVGSSAASCCRNVVSFFELIQQIYVFFSATTHRWQVLNKHLSVSKDSVSIKKLSDTRWSARADACSSLAKNWKLVIAAGEEIKNDTTQKSTTTCEIEGILKRLDTLDMAVQVVFWKKLLISFNKVSKMLQSPEIDLSVVVELYDSLIGLVSDCRNDFDSFETEAINLSGHEAYEQLEKRIKKRKGFFDEAAEEKNEESTPQERARNDFRINTFLRVIDHLLSQLEYRINAYKKFVEKFLFLNKIINLENNEIKQKSEILREIYKNDVDDHNDVLNELIILKEHLKVKKIETVSFEQLYKIVLELKDLYPNIEILLRIFLATAAANCTAERSFSVLKRLKNYLRSSMTEDRLNYLATLHLNYDITQDLNYDDVITDFAIKKSRKKIFSSA